jgi:perosamine synthetase
LCTSLRNQGRNQKNDWLIHERLGYNYRLDEMSAALGITQLSKVDWMIKQKEQIVNWYNQELDKNPNIMLPRVGKNRTHTWFVYVVRIINGKRDYVLKKLAEMGIQTKPYLPAIHLQPFIKKTFNFRKGDFPVTEKVASQTLALPLYIGLKRNEVKYISSQLNELCK